MGRARSGWHHSEETKNAIGRKNSMSLKGHKLPQEVIDKIVAKTKGRKYPGRVNSCSFKNGHTAWNKGLVGVIKRTPEMRITICEEYI